MNGDKFFEILEGSKCINMAKRLEVWTCHDIYDRICTMEEWEGWRPESETARTLLLGFQARYGNELADNNALSIAIQDMYSLYSFSVNDREVGKKMWLEYSAHRFKDEFAYANQTRLEKLTIYEIRKLASKEGIELPAGRKLKAELIAEFGRQITEEDKVKMRKIGLNEAISAIEAATTEDAVRAVLENCTKAQIEEVYIAVTGNEYDKKPYSCIKASLVLYYAERIIAYKAREAFKEMTIAEKAEYLKSGKYLEAHCRLDNMLWTCTPYDLISLVRAMGIGFKVYEVWHKEKSSVSFEPVLRIVIENALDILELSEQLEPASKDDDPAPEPSEVSYADVKDEEGTEEQDMQEVEELNERKDSLEAEITDKRREFLGIAEALKVMKGSRHYSGLLVIKARVEDEYKLLRLESLRVRKKLRWYAERLDELREMLKEILTESCEQLLVAI